MSSLSSLSTLTSLSGSESAVSAGSPTLVSHSEKGSSHRSFQQELEEWVSSKRAQQITLDEFWAALHHDSSNFKQDPFTESIHPKSNFSYIMAKLCGEMHTECGLASEWLISFRALHKCSMSGRRNSQDKKDRPHFIASTSIAYTAPEIHWSGVDAIAEMSSHHPGPGGHAISHTVQLLKARPDLICAFGMYVDDDDILLILSSPSGVVLSPKLRPSVAADVQIMYAFVKRLYEPHPSMVDPTIRRRQDACRKSWVFDINLSFPGQVETLLCAGYSILASHRSIGERSHIFYNTESPAVIDGKPMRVLKEHYRHPDNTHSEAEILHHIHAEGTLPGVVEMLYSEKQVVRPDGSPVLAGSLIKTRIGLHQYGTSFMDLKTPREVLMAVYDLLEVTRVLHSSRGVMHRDISDGNVLIAPDAAISSTSPLEGIGTTDSKRNVCFIRHLLGQTNNPATTSILLIDLDQGIIINGLDPENLPQQRLFTHRFMARAISKGLPWFGTPAWILPRDILSPAREIYEQVHPERIKRFGSGPPSLFAENQPRDSKIDHTHRLWYEAESAYWLLFWWSVRARAITSRPSYIRGIVWHLFNDNTSQERRSCTVGEVLDEAYSPLQDFLSSIALSVRCDLRLATEEPYSSADYLHEVIQRKIVNFLLENDRELFLDIPKADEPRVYCHLLSPP